MNTKSLVTWWTTPVIHPLITTREEYPGFTELMSATSVDLVVVTGLRGSGRWMARQGHLTVLGVSKPLTQQSKKTHPFERYRRSCLYHLLRRSTYGIISAER